MKVAAGRRRSPQTVSQIWKSLEEANLEFLGIETARNTARTTDCPQTEHCAEVVTTSVEVFTKMLYDN